MFWILAAVLGIAALAFVLRPLLKPPVLDPAADKRRALRAAHAAGALDDAELAQRLNALGPAPLAAAPAGASLILLLAVLVPALSVGFYLWVGNPDALDPAAAVATAAATPASMEEAIVALEARLEAEPTDIEGWVLLGRSRRNQERFADAEKALARAHALAPDEVEILIDYAEAKALATPERRFGGESLALLQQAQTRDPGNPRARWLLGIAAMQGGRPAEAVELWEALLADMPPDASARNALSKQINDARAQAGLPPLPDSAPAVPPMLAAPAAAAPAAATASASTDAVAGPRIEVNVSLDPAIASAVPTDAVLFVFARAPQGSRAPLAIQRMPASALPATVVLDNSMGMIAGMNLSSQTEVIIGARISASGNAAPQSGDLEGLLDPQPVGIGKVDLRIDRVLP
jgi:cytochrome c-type biogenesis protein CcmH